MIQVEVRDIDLQEAAAKGMDEFIQVFVDAIYKSIGGELTQLIHNGYGSVIFKNPFAKAVKAWGMKDLCRMVYDVHTLYAKYHDEIEKDCTDDEFMAMFEQYPEFDDYDDGFVENEELWTEDIAHYIDSNIEKFAKIV